MSNPAGGDFPPTRWSAVVAARSDQPIERARARDAVVAAYWRPVYKYIRLRWRQSREDAEDSTQEFFQRLLDRDFLADYDPARARLRTYLRMCIDRMLSNQVRAAQRHKRGGGHLHLSLDFATADGELSQLDPAATDDLEGLFDREFVRSLFSLAVEALQRDCLASGKQQHFELFRRYDLEDAHDQRPTYAVLAAEFGIATTDVTNRLAWARREFRKRVLHQLRAMTSSDEEYRREARNLLGLDPQ